jgi:HAE1 family hydrophobic/amphiphilic exporter-1
VKLADVSIRRPVFAVMLVGGLVVLGLVSIPRLGIDLWPRVEFPMIVVTTVLEGAAPETVERELSQVLEESINTIEGINSLRSRSSDSLSILYVEFELEYEIETKAQEVREKVAAVRGELPRDAEPPVVERVDPDAQPILTVMIAGPESIRSISEFADKRLKPRLERIPGVGSVTLTGGRQREIRIWIDPLRLGGYGLAVDDVLSVLEREHVELPGGRLETAQREWSLRTEGKLTNAEQFGALAVAERGGSVIHLRDVARVEDGMAEERTISRLNGRRGVALQIRRQSGENTVAVADAVKADLELVRADLPAGYEMLVARDASRFISRSIRDVAIALAFGALLASVVVFLFLRNARSTLITALAIPCSIVGSFAFFYFFGFTLNTMTLMALSLSIGLLIDDAVVVLENSYRHMELGKPPAEAASDATQEIGLAVIATSLAIAAVFVPIAFMSGVVGRFFREFGIVATCAVFTSTLVALTLVPMLCSRYLKPGEQQGRAHGWLESLYDLLERRYRRTLAWGLAHRPLTLLLAFVTVGAGLAVARAVPVTFMTPEDRGEFNVWLKMPLGSAIQTTQGVTTRVEESLRGVSEVDAVFSTVGAGVEKRVNEAEIFVHLIHKSERDRTQQEVMAAIRARIRDLDLPLREYTVEEIGLFSVAGSRNAQLMYAIRGPDTDKLQYYARGLMEQMRRAGGYADVTMSYETGKPEIALEITRDRAADLGVPAIQIGRTISALFAGYRAATFEEGGERYDVRVQVLPEYRDDPDKLSLVRVRAPGGALVPLKNLVNPRIGSGPVQIERENRTRAITLRGNLDGKSAGEADVEIVRFAEMLDIETGYEFEAVGPSKRMRESLAAIAFAFVLALVAIYMILASQFNSFVHPLTIMLSAPLSFIGAFAAVALMGHQLDTLGQIAFLMLMGIVMKNGILLVDYINTLRARGRPLRDAVLEAGPVRLRPVLMTAVSTVCGMMPLAYGSGDGSEWRNPMGVVCIGGLVASTLLTLLIVPIAYTLIDDAQSIAGRALRRVGMGVRGTGSRWSDRSSAAKTAPAPQALPDAHAHAHGPSGEAILPSAHEHFWEQGSFAFVGDTAGRGFPKRSYRELRRQGKKVFAVDASADEIEGDPSHPDLKSLPEKVDAVVLDVPSEQTRDWVERAADAGIRNVWIHIGRDTPEALELAEERGLNVLTGNVKPSFSSRTLRKWVGQLAGGS